MLKLGWMVAGAEAELDGGGEVVGAEAGLDGSRW